MRILVATRSPHKLAEIREMVEDLPLDVVSLAELAVPETPGEEGVEVHETFGENARAKALHFHRRTGLPTLADDSGLCVDALGGGPGVRTKRFAPERLVRELGRDAANNRWLLERLRGVPEEERGARYRCVLALVPDPGTGSGGEGPARVRVVEGRVEGRIASEPAGEGGFGYDPLFLLPDRGRTFAELPPAVKRERSHRAGAVRAMRPWLERLAASGAAAGGAEPDDPEEPREDPLGSP